MTIMDIDFIDVGGRCKDGHHQIDAKDVHRHRLRQLRPLREAGRRLCRTRACAHVNCVRYAKPRDAVRAAQQLDDAKMYTDIAATATQPVFRGYSSLGTGGYGGSGLSATTVPEKGATRCQDERPHAQGGRCSRTCDSTGGVSAYRCLKADDTTACDFMPEVQAPANARLWAINEHGIAAHDDTGRHGLRCRSLFGAR